MADRKISELQPLAQFDIRSADELAVADRSASETRKVTVPDLTQAGIRLMPDNSINGSKLEDNSVENGKLVDQTIIGGSNGKIAFDTITQENLAPGSVGFSELQNNAVYTAAIQDNAVNGDKIADDAVETRHIAFDAVGPDELANNAVDTAAIQNDAVTGEKLNSNAFDRGIDLTNDKVGITNSITPGTQAGISYNEQGLITGVVDPIPSADLPIATQTEIGAVSVPADSGLGVTGTGALFIDNNPTAGTYTKVTIDEHGLVTLGGLLQPTDLPLATSTTPGAVIVPATDADGDTALDIAGTGDLTHATSGVTAGTYPKVTVNKYGHVTNGAQLQASDIPEISADKITSGEIDSDLLAECSVTAPKICDYATCLMQEDHPGPGDFLGQFWFTPSTAQLRVYARGSGPQNIWLPVGFGALQADNLRWLGTYDADTDTIVSLTTIGQSYGLSAGDSFPVPTDALSGGYFLCQVAGNNCTQNDLTGITHDPGDWALCIDGTQGWIHIDAAPGGGGGGGGGGAQYLNDLLDVTIGGVGGPFSTAPAMTLAGNQLFKYDSGSGKWRNTDRVDGGDF